MRWWWMAIVPALLLAACGGAERDDPGAGVDAPASAVVDADARFDSDAPFDPDSGALTRLIIWSREDNLGTVARTLPPAQQQLIDQLLASDSVAADKYIVDLVAFPNPYRPQVLDHLRDRYATPSAETVYDFPEIFDFDPRDTDTDAYVTFKRALFRGQFPEMALMMDPGAARTIDAREVVWGGVGVDGIPPLEFPAQVSAEAAAAWINDTDAVIGVVVNGDVRAYPIRIIAWHEMVNDTVGGLPVSLSYCTLCGSAILYDGRVGGEVFRFGTSGLLYRSNKLMYDRVTRTLWNQFSGEPAWGPLVGTGARLRSLPVVYTTWGAWQAQRPQTTVLSIETGFARDYGPGVAYAEYNASPDPLFNVPVVDERLAAKDEVYVVRAGDALTAYPITLLAERVLVLDVVGELAVVVIVTADGQGARSFESGGVRFTAADPVAGTLTDRDGAIWTITEAALEGPAGQTLPRVSGHNAFWFAVVNQTPDGVLYEG